MQKNLFTEQEFNAKLCHILSNKFNLEKKWNNLKENSKEFEVFLFLQSPASFKNESDSKSSLVDGSRLSLSDLRLMLLAQFLAKISGKKSALETIWNFNFQNFKIKFNLRIQINVCIKNENIFLKDLEDIFKFFEFDKFLFLKKISTEIKGEEKVEWSPENFDPQFIVKDEEENRGTLVDLALIVQSLRLEFYDQSLKLFYGKFKFA